MKGNDFINLNYLLHCVFFSIFRKSKYGLCVFYHNLILNFSTSIDGANDATCSISIASRSEQWTVIVFSNANGRHINRYVHCSVVDENLLNKINSAKLHEPKISLVQWPVVILSCFLKFVGHAEELISYCILFIMTHLNETYLKIKKIHADHINCTIFSLVSDFFNLILTKFFFVSFYFRMYWLRIKTTLKKKTFFLKKYSLIRLAYT